MGDVSSRFRSSTTALVLVLAFATPASGGVPTCFGRAATIVGTDRGDEVEGTAGDDVIVTKGGADIVDGRGGDDRICTGSGPDRVRGGPGRDRIDTGSGRDRANGNDGGDRLDGGPAADALVGGGGADRVSGGLGEDLIEGGAGDDELDGFQLRTSSTSYQPSAASDDGADTMRGGSGDDAMEGGAGDDRLEGDEGADMLSGEAGADVLHGGDDDDTLDGGGGDDALHGDAGADALHGAAGNDELHADEDDIAVEGGDGHDIQESLFDDFEDENNGQTAYVYNGFAHWTVTSGSVDLVAPAWWEDPSGPCTACPPPDLEGMIVDTQGGGHGTMSSKASFGIQGGTYVLRFSIEGNNRCELGGAATQGDTLTVTWGSFTESFTRACSAPGELIERTVTFSSASPAPIAFSTGGGSDLYGMLLGDVMLMEPVS